MNCCCCISNPDTSIMKHLEIIRQDDIGKQNFFSFVDVISFLYLLEFHYFSLISFLNFVSFLHISFDLFAFVCFFFVSLFSSLP